MDNFSEGYIVGQNSNNDGFGNGASWIWIILLFAIFGGGWGGNWGNNGGGQMQYDIGKLATTNDVASGFSTSAIMGNQREIQLTLTNMQNYINQGFSGLNASVVDVGYQVQNCCCQTQRAIDAVNYNMAKHACDIIQAGNMNTQRLIDIYQNDRFEKVRDENLFLKFKDSQKAQNQFITQVGADIVNRLQPPPVPSFNVPSPYYAGQYSPYYAGHYNGGYGCNNGCFWGN